MATEKVCKGKCGENLPLHMFYKHIHCKYGRAPRCISCSREEEQSKRISKPVEGTFVCCQCHGCGPSSLFSFQYSDADKTVKEKWWNTKF